MLEDTDSIQREDLQAYIENEVEERLDLEYKSAPALGRQNNKKDEITKDISSFANAAGGRIIYGIAEFDDSETAHIPESLDPIQRQEFSKEWLEQIVQQIRPKLDKVRITPVPLDDQGGVAYVVDVPQGNTAHQARDLRYYVRRNFQAIPMQDYEIRDVMSRSAHPLLEAKLRIEIDEYEVTTALPSQLTRQVSKSLRLQVFNVGHRVAHYVKGFLVLPSYLVHESVRTAELDDVEEISFSNTTRDVVGSEPGYPRPRPRYGPRRYVPILPLLGQHGVDVRLVDGLSADFTEDEVVSWSIYADEAPRRVGETALEEIEWIDLRK